ncbi:MAG: hypothetical protein AAF528_01230 [Cyanobacteria bacterium P01_C01_bin.121]
MFGLVATAQRDIGLIAISPFNFQAAAAVVYLQVLPSSSFLVVEPDRPAYSIIPKPSMFTVDGVPSFLSVLGQDASALIASDRSIFEVIPRG